jgi:hypothetical protein
MIAPIKRWRTGYLLIILLFLPGYAGAQADITASDTLGCTPLSVQFILDPGTVDTDTITDVEWHFGDGTIRTAGPTDTVEFEYTVEGNYTVTVVIDDDVLHAVEKEDYITVFRTVSSAFEYEEYASNHNFRFIPLDEITDSTTIYFYNWRYDELTGDDLRINDYVITLDNQLVAIDSVTLDTGVYEVTLWIDDSNGCFSRFTDTVTIADEIVLPNYFVAGRPHPDKFYVIDPQNANIILRFQVFNRYGMLVFEQEAHAIYWDGRTNGGRDLSTGVYYYILEAVRGDLTNRYNQYGFIHLFRSD